MGCAPGGSVLRTVAASRRIVRAAFAHHVGRAYATVKNGVTNINALTSHYL
jgi:hypothetical protein